MLKTLLLTAAAALTLTSLAVADDNVATSDAFSGSQQTLTAGTVTGAAFFGTSSASSSNFASTHGGAMAGAHADEDSTFTFAGDNRTTVTWGESESNAFGAAAAVAAEARANYGEQFGDAHAEAGEDDGWSWWY